MTDGSGPGRLYEFLQSRRGDASGAGWTQATPWKQLTGPIREECIAAYEFVRAESEKELTAAREFARELADAWKEAYDHELEGAAALRADLGARDEETFQEFVRRIARERDESDARAKELETQLDVLEDRVCTAGGQSALLEDAFTWFRLRDDAARKYRNELASLTAANAELVAKVAAWWETVRAAELIRNMVRMNLRVDTDSGAQKRMLADAFDAIPEDLRPTETK